jgi:hypothetical protein
MYIPNDCQQIETSRRLYLLHRKVLAALRAERFELEAEVLRAQAPPDARAERPDRLLVGVAAHRQDQHENLGRDERTRPVRKSNVRVNKPKTPRARTPSTLVLHRGCQNNK